MGYLQTASAETADRHRLAALGQPDPGRDRVAAGLEQEEIHLAYGGQTWTLIAELEIGPHADVVGGPQ